MKLPTGKVNPYKLLNLIFPHLDSNDERVLVGPEVGLDAAVVELPDRVIVLSSDPITGFLHDPGWLSVHVNANDVATMGAVPKWFLVNFFLPEGTEDYDVEKLAMQASEACSELDINLVGGHTEVTPGLDRILISGAMIGEASKDEWVTAGGARPDDRIILTKGVGIEGTFILARDREEELKNILGEQIVNKAKKFSKKLSVVEEALTAVRTGGVTAMHDPTEGGLAGGLNELADASNVGFKINRDSVYIPDETRAIFKSLDIDPLKTISSGSLLICVKPGNVSTVLDSLHGKNINASDIGVILQNKETRVIDDESLEYPKQDELWRIFKD